MAIGTETLQKLVFTNDGKTIAYSIDGLQTYEYEFSSLQRIYYTQSEFSSAGLTEEQNPRLFIYPNPVTETLVLRGLAEGENAFIFNNNGALVETMKGNGAELRQDVSSLWPGIYSLKAGQKSLKFIKR